MPEIEESRWVIFRVADKCCALPLDCIAEILPVPMLSRPPGLPELLEGFLNTHGQRVPVLRLEHLFGLPTTTLGLYWHVIVLKSRPESLALLVDYVLEVRPLDAASLAALHPQRVFNDCTASETLLDGKPLYILSPQQLLLDEERRRLEQLQAIGETRLQHLNQGVA